METILKLITWLAAALLAAGLVMTLSGSTQAAYVLHAGLWLLISTPVIRVMLALYDYTRERNWTFVALTLVVLACLAIPLARYFASFPR